MLKSAVRSYNKMGSREICNAVFRAKTKQKFGSMTFEKGEPVLYMDTCKTSSLDGDATTVYATGGRGDNKLIAWEGEKSVTYTMEDALISPMGMAILTGAGLTDASNDNIVHVHKYGDVTATYSNGELSVDLTDELGTNVLCTKTPVYGFVKNSRGVIIAKVGKGTTTDGSNVVKFTAPAGVTEDSYMKIDYYIIKRSNVTSVSIEPDKFGGYFYFEADTLYRDEATTEDIACAITIPKVKIQSKFTFGMSASGDPSTFTFTMDAFPDYTEFNKKKKVLACMDFIYENSEDEEENEELHTHDVPGDFVECEFTDAEIASSSTDKMLTIPYARYNANSNVKLTVTDNNGKVVFREEDTMEDPNLNASFTWGLRDFSSLDAKKASDKVAGLKYDSDNHFIFVNGCESKSQVSAIDNDNEKIIPAGTVLTIQIEVDSNKVAGSTVISKKYTVSSDDVTNVTR